MDRFWNKVDRSGGPDACHPWTASVNDDGYGRFKLDGTMVAAHRVAFFLEHGSWPEPCGRHTCNNPPCCNARHVIEGTHAQNMGDLRASGRRKGRGTGRTNGRSTMPECTARGDAHGMAKLTSRQVAQIKTLRSAGHYPTAIAKEFGVDRSTIYRVLKGETWTHV